MQKKHRARRLGDWDSVPLTLAQDSLSGEVCGIYFFEDHAALAAFRESELAQTISTAYEASDIRREIYAVLYPLHPERGPFSE